MVDRRKKRGAAPEDRSLFGDQELPRLREATDDYCHLLERGYAAPSALELVGNRYQLVLRQRQAVSRCATSETTVRARRSKRVEPADLKGRSLAIDAFNQLILLETALGGGVLFRGRDDCLRDLAGVHGTWRRRDDSGRALSLLAEELAARATAKATWYVDRAVSNSGRLRELILAEAERVECAWEVQVDGDVDRAVATSGDVVLSSDSWVLDQSASWCDLLGAVVSEKIPDSWVVKL